MSHPLPLTRRQREVLDFIVEFMAARKVAPTLREISERFGFASTAGAQKHVLALQAKGYLRREKHRSRGLVLLADGAGTGSRAVTVPLLGLVAAGQPVESLPDPEDIVVPAGMVGPGEHFVLKVRGDSMIDDGILDGDLVVVQARQSPAEGDVVVALVDGEVTLKRFFTESPGIVRLQPANPTMEPLRVDARKVSVQGVVVGLLRSYR